jgi:hypothetical protein
MVAAASVVIFWWWWQRRFLWQWFVVEATAAVMVVAVVVAAAGVMVCGGSDGSCDGGCGGGGGSWGGGLWWWASEKLKLAGPEIENPKARPKSICEQMHSQPTDVSLSPLHLEHRFALASDHKHYFLSLNRATKKRSGEVCGGHPHGALAQAKEAAPPGARRKRSGPVTTGLAREQVSEGLRL